MGHGPEQSGTATAIEDRRHDQGLAEVVGEGHAPGAGQGIEDHPPPPRPVDQRQGPGIAERHRQAQQAVDHRRPGRTGVDGECDGPKADQAHGDRQPIGFDQRLSLEEAAVEQAKPDHHTAERHRQIAHLRHRRRCPGGKITGERAQEAGAHLRHRRQIRHAVPRRPIGQNGADDKDDQPEGQRTPPGHKAPAREEKTANGIEQQDIAVPDQSPVDQAEHDQPKQAPLENPRLGADQKNADPEQHG